jgi:DNA primase
MLALGMTADNPLKKYLEAHPEIKKIGFRLDNDEPGRKASYKLAEKYIRLGYRADILFAPEGCKDFNDWVRSLRGAVKATEKSRNR